MGMELAEQAWEAAALHAAAYPAGSPHEQGLLDAESALGSWHSQALDLHPAFPVD